MVRQPYLGPADAGPDDKDRLAQRGYLFSSVAYALISVHPIVLFAGQVIAIAVGVWALVQVEYRMTGWIRLSPLLLLVPSLWLAPSHMMTESISFACASTGFLLLLTRHGAWAAVVLWAGALIKPALLLGAMVSLVVTIRCRLILPLVLFGLLVACGESSSPLAPSGQGANAATPTAS